MEKKVNEAPKGLQTKLLALQGCVRGLAKDAKAGNGSYSYPYISGSKLLGVVRPAMDELGLRLAQEMDTDGIQFQGTNAIVPFIFTWIDTESGEREAVRWLAVGSNTPLDKAIGSAATYAERYFIMKQLHLATDEDDTDALTPEDFGEKVVETAPAPAPKKAPQKGAKKPAVFSLPEGVKGLSKAQYNTYVRNVAVGLRSQSEVEKGFREACGADDIAIGLFRKDVNDYTAAMQ